MPNKSLLFCLVLIVIITIKAYSPSVNNDFTNWDDPQYVLNNDYIKEFNADNIKAFFTQPFVAHYSPLALLSLSIDYQLYKLNPKGYHRSNLIIHILNCLLVFWLIYLISGKSIGVSFIVAILFGIHPMHVESVAWIAERKDVLFAFFFMLSAIGYMLYKSKQKLKFYYASLVCLMFSLLSKSMGITMPVVLLLIDYFILKKLTRKELIEKIPFFVVSLFFAVLIFIITYQTQTESESNDYSFSLLHSFLAANYNVLFYLKMLILPTGLSPFYPYPSDYANTIPLLFILSPVLLLLIIFVAHKYLRRNKLFLFGALFFIVTLSPVLQLIPFGDALSADRYTYIPYLGLYFIIASAFGNLWNSKTKLADIRKIVLAALLAIIVSLLAIQTHKRCQVWKNSESLWTDASAKYPSNTLINYNLGCLYHMQGQNRKAIGIYENALEYKGNFNYVDIYYNMGIAYINMRDYHKAVTALENAVKIRQDNPYLYYSLGSAYYNIDQLELAENVFNMAINLKPNHIGTLLARGVIYAERKEFDAALTDWYKVLEIQPNNKNAQENISYVYSIME